MRRRVVNDWLAKTRAKRFVQITNIRDKIADYAPILPYPQAKLERLILLCETYIALFNYVEQSRATLAQLNSYETMVNMAKNGTRNASAPEFVGFKTLALPNGAFVGLIPELRELVDDIKHADNYARNIGEDLMIVVAESERISERDIMPKLKLAPIAGTYRVRVEGKMLGMDALRLDWLKKGASNWQIGVGFLTKLPGEVEIAPTSPGEPEAGELRGILIDKNEPVGQFSLNHPITIG